MKTELLSGLKRLCSRKTARKVNRVMAFMLSVVLLATSVSVDALAADLTQSATWEDYGVFKGTVFGNVGGGSKISTDFYSLGADENGDLRIAGIQKSSKISAGDGDGFGMYYYQIPATSTFSFSAKATVNSAGDGGQSAFGLTARDDIQIDDDTASKTNYVVAGSRGNGENCFTRTDEATITSGGNLSAETLTAGSTYDLKLESSDAGYVCTFGKEAAVTFDTNLTGTDAENIYLGMFISRLADVTYSDIKLVVDGEVVFDQTADDEEDEDGDEDGSSGAVVDPSETDGFIQTKPYEGVTYEFNFQDPTRSDIWELGDATEAVEGTALKSGQLGLMNVVKAGLFHDTQHGMNKAATFEIKVAGSCEIAVGGCKFSGGNDVFTMTSSTGTIKEATLTAKTENCYDANRTDGTDRVVFTYTGEAGTVTLNSVGSYIPVIIVTPIEEEEEGDPNETDGFVATKAYEGVTYEFNFQDPTRSDIWELGDASEAVEGTALKSGKLGLMNVVKAGQFHDTQHGMNKAATFEIKVAGNCEIAIGGCKFSGSGDTFTMTSTTGKIDEESKKAQTTNCYDANRTDGSDRVVFTYVGGAGTVTLTSVGSYIPTIVVTPIGEVVESDPSEPNGFIATKAYEGITYTFDLTDTSAPIWDMADGEVAVSGTMMKTGKTGLMTVTKAAKYHNSYGTGGAMEVEIAVAGNSKISVGSCQHSTGNNATVASATGEVLEPSSQSIQTSADKAMVDFYYLGEKGSVKIAIDGGYIHSFVITPLTDEEAEELENNKVIDPMESNGFVAKTPNREVTYTFDFQASTAKIYGSDGTMKSGAVGLVTVNTPGKYYNDHGFTGTTDMDIAVSGDCRIDIMACQYGNPGIYSFTSETGTIDPASQESVVKTDKTYLSFYYTGEAGTVNFKSTASYTHKIVITPILSKNEIFDSVLEKYDPNRKIDVWDFGGVEESDTSKYNNNITKSFWDGLDSSLFEDSAQGRFKANGEFTFGDLVMKYNSADRLYYNNADNTDKGVHSDDKNKYKNDFKDGYVSLGAYYAAGTGGNDGKDSRCLVLNNVYAGDVITAYAHVNNAAMDLHFLYLGEDGNQDDFVRVEFETYTKGTFTAEYSGTYLLYMNNGNGKPRYLRVVREPGVMVSGSIDLNGHDISDYTVVLQDVETGSNYDAFVQEDGTFKAFAPANATLTAIMKGAIGYGFTEDSKVIKTTSEATDGVKLVVGTRDLVTLNGKIEGISTDYDKSKLNLVLNCTDASLMKDSVKMEIADDWTYAVLIEKGVEYELAFSGANDYELAEKFVVKGDADVEKNVVIAAKALYAVSGNFIGLAEGAKPASIKFTNLADKYEYSGTVTETGYAGNLRDGDYEITASVDGYDMVAHVVVKGAAATKDILYVSKAAAEALPFVADIYVGCPDEENNYETVRAAVKAIEAMRKTNATDRITVHIAPGLYREQVILDSPNVSFVNTNPEEEVKLTWYYGVGYEYYSSNKYYDEKYAFDKYIKTAADKWGAATYIKSKATNFYAENITFENSFTKYITDEEIADGVTPSGTMPDRTAPNAVASSRAYNERSAGLAVEGDKAEFYNCTILGGQDTLYTGSVKVYFNDCFIEGNTDYIFGGGEILFENCELQFYGYSDTTSGPVLTAATDTQKYGYIFRNCFISANPDWPVAPGKLGRPWGANAMVNIINCKLQNTGVIEPVGWGDMSGNKAVEANFGEFNTTSVDGKAVDISQRVTGNLTVNPYPTSEDVISKAFSGWTPSTFVTDTNDVAVEKALTVVGEVKVGNVLTADFALNGNNEAVNSSVIQWYRVTAEGETLVKASVAYVDRTYTVTGDDINAQIKVVVLPETVSGYTADAVSATSEAVAEPTLEEVVDNAIANTDSAEEAMDVILSYADGEMLFEAMEENPELAEKLEEVMVEAAKENPEKVNSVAKEVVTADATIENEAEELLTDGEAAIEGAEISGFLNGAKEVELVVGTPDEPVEVNEEDYPQPMKVQLDIKLVDENDNEVALKVPVTVTIPAPKGFKLDATLKLLHYADDGSCEEVAITSDGEKVSFTVSHFSTFVFAGEPVAKPEDPKPEDPKPEDPKPEDPKPEEPDDDNIKDGEDDEEDDEDEDEDEDDKKSILDAILSPKTFFDEGSFIHSILWPETDNEQEASVEQNAEADTTDAEDAQVVGGALVQNAEKSGLGNMFAIILVAAVAVIAASGVVLFRKKDEEM